MLDLLVPFQHFVWFCLIVYDKQKSRLMLCILNRFTCEYLNSGLLSPLSDFLIRIALKVLMINLLQMWGMDCLIIFLMWMFLCPLNTILDLIIEVYCFRMFNAFRFPIYLVYLNIDLSQVSAFYLLRIKYGRIIGTEELFLKMFYKYLFQKWA